MITLEHVNPRGTRVYMGTLTHGADVHNSFVQMARELNIPAAKFDMLGGLSRVELSEYDAVTRQRKGTRTFERHLEVVGGHGTLSWLNVAPQVHLHLVIAFQDETHAHGITLIGGHVIRATAFALEFTLNVYEGAPVERAMDEGTGLALWHLPIFETRP